MPVKSFVTPTALTPEQHSTLKTAAYADPAFVSILANGQTPLIVDAMNAEYVPAYVVWKSRLTPEDARAAIMLGSAQLDALGQGKRDSLFWLVQGDLDVGDPNIRAAISDLCGTQNVLKNYLIGAQKKNASWAERHLATGAGTTASPSTMGWTGYISEADIYAILAS